MKKKGLLDNSTYRINYTSDISDYSQKTIDYKHEISFHSKENFTCTNYFNSGACCYWLDDA